MTERSYKLKKVEPRKQPFVTATYAVVVDGRTMGHVDKYEQPTGNPATPKRRVSTSVCWGWRCSGSRLPEDESGYERRIDALVHLMQDADVPRET